MKGKNNYVKYVENAPTNSIKSRSCIPMIVGHKVAHSYPWKNGTGLASSSLTPHNQRTPCEKENPNNYSLNYGKRNINLALSTD